MSDIQLSEPAASSSSTQVKMATDTSRQENSPALRDQIWRYLPLRKAALRCDWEKANRIFEKDEGALTAAITETLETALHIAVGTGVRAVHFVEKLVNLMPVEALALPTTDGDTALHIAAWVGNTEAALILVEKRPNLLYIPNENGFLPLHCAAQNAHKDTLLYLLTAVTMDDHPVALPFPDESGVLLLLHLIDSRFYDVALALIRRYPELAHKALDDGRSALEGISGEVSAFRSGTCLTLWQSFVYSYVPVKLENYIEDHNRGDIENSINNCPVIAKKNSFSESQKLPDWFWKALELLVPHIKHIRETKLMHLGALQLVKCLCREILSYEDLDACASLTEQAILSAARLGIHEVVEEIADSFPGVVWTKDSKNRNIFQLAVIHRCENVFNLIYQMSGNKQFMTNLVDDSGNTILHLAGRLAPPNKLNLITGAVVQMQRELQWFKVVKEFVPPHFVKRENHHGETPWMVFTVEHKELVAEGEKWMKDIASACIAPALIATVMFAAAITVPGGNNGVSGFPIFSKEKAFTIFAISDAVSLFTSTNSLLMFISLLTSRYKEDDFLYILPKRLIIGLCMLFLSISSMMIASASTLYLVFGQGKPWFLVPLAALSCLPITSFVSLQFPLLLDLIRLTYGPGNFGKKSDRPFY